MPLVAAGRIRMAADASMLLHEQVEHERELGRLHGLPDQDAITRAWAEGAALSVEQAVAVARGS